MSNICPWHMGESSMMDKRAIDRAYADPAIAAKQREIVSSQLMAMHAGKTVRLFSVVGEILQGLRDESDYDTVTLLDAGCASCYYKEVIDYYVPGWVNYTGVDYNPGMIKMVHELYPGLPIHQADACDLSIFSDGSFDIVMEGALLMQIRDWKSALSELARVAKHWLILHRENLHWGHESTSCEVVSAYDKQVWAVRINKGELTGFLLARGFRQLSMTCTSSDGDPRSGRTILYGRS